MEQLYVVCGMLYKFQYHIRHTTYIIMDCYYILPLIYLPIFRALRMVP